MRTVTITCDRCKRYYHDSESAEKKFMLRRVVLTCGPVDGVNGTITNAEWCESCCIDAGFITKDGHPVTLGADRLNVLAQSVKAK